MKNKPYDFADHSATSIENLIMQHLNRQDNPHRVTKEDVQLDKVDNTSDAEKPMSAAQKEYMAHEINHVEVKVNEQLELNHIENERLRSDLIDKFNNFSGDVNNHLKQEHNYVEVNLASIRDSIIRSAEEVQRIRAGLIEKMDLDYKELTLVINRVDEASKSAINLLSADLHQQIRTVNSKLKEDLSKLNADLINLANQVDNRLVELKANVDSNDAKQTRNLSDAVEEINLKLAQLALDFDNKLNNHILDFEKHLGDYDVLFQSVDKQFGNIQTSLDAHVKEFEDLRKELTATDELVKTVKTGIDGLKLRQVVVEKAVQTISDTVNAAVQAIRLLSDTVNEALNRELPGIHQSIENLESTKANRVELEEAKTELNTTINNVKSELEEVHTTDKNELAKQIEDAKKEIQFEDIQNVPENHKNATTDYIDNKVINYHDDTKEDKFGLLHTLPVAYMDPGYDYNNLSNLPDLDAYGKVKGVEMDGASIVNNSDKIARFTSFKLNSDTIVNKETQPKDFETYVNDQSYASAVKAINFNVPDMIKNKAEDIADTKIKAAIEALPDPEVNEQANVTDLIASIAGKVGN